MSKVEADKVRAQLRADFPFAVAMVEALKSDASHPEYPPFSPRVLWMKQDGKEWHKKP